MTLLEVGAEAPDLWLPTLGGRDLRLASLRGHKVLIALLRNARCAVCNLWVHDTSQRARAWSERGLAVVAVFEAPMEKLDAQFEGRDVPMRLVADPSGAIHEALGSINDASRVKAIVASGEAAPMLARAQAAGFEPVREPEANFDRIPAEVLLDEHGVVRWIHRAERITNHLAPEVVERFIDGRLTST